MHSGGAALSGVEVMGGTSMDVLLQVHVFAHSSAQRVSVAARGAQQSGQETKGIASASATPGV